jgi:hypothetical protein
VGGGGRQTWRTTVAGRTTPASFRSGVKGLWCGQRHAADDPAKAPDPRRAKQAGAGIRHTRSTFEGQSFWGGFVTGRPAAAPLLL